MNEGLGELRCRRHFLAWSLNPACIFRGMCYNVHIFLLNEYSEHKWDGSEDLY